ncbi:MAG: AraC family transcriptional regulator [Cocleimonas sp.]|nr:AraC family transcriptional regulator [Cocleimonas sp.]
MKQITGQNYRQRLTQVIDYIFNHLEGDLSVNTLAEIAFMSPYHFHRIYRGLAQETLNASIRRLRLQRAAMTLINSSQSILSIAKSVAYNSQEAFTRAFTQHFGETPYAYRKARQSRYLTSPSFTAVLPEQQHHENEIMFAIEIMELEQIDLHGYQHSGDYLDIGKAFEKLIIYAASNNLLDEKTRSIGIYYDDPASIQKDKLRSVACLTLPEKELPKMDDMPEPLQIPAGNYATLLFKGAYPELEAPYNYLFGKWLPESGYEAADFPPFEEYLNNPKDTPPNELLTRIHCLLV